MISPRICCSWFFNIIFLCPTKLRFCYIYSAICQSVVMNHTVGCCEDSAECHQNSSTTVVSTTPNWHHEGLGTCNKLDLIFLIILTQNWVKGDSGTSVVAAFIFLGIPCDNLGSIYYLCYGYTLLCKIMLRWYTLLLFWMFKFFCCILTDY